MSRCAINDDMILKEIPQPQLNALEVRCLPEKSAVVERAVRHLETSLREALAQGKKILFLVSGGSNIDLLKAIDQVLLANPNITIFPLDERHDAGALNNSLIIQAAGIPIHPMVPMEGETVTEFGKRYHAFLANWMAENSEGTTIALIGIGPDGHTAGISPGIQAWFDATFMALEENTWAAGYEGNLQPPQRVTVTPQFLAEKLDEGVVVATGAAKTEALQKTTTAGEMGETPARVLNKTIGKMTLYTDVEL